MITTEDLKKDYIYLVEYDPEWPNLAVEEISAVRKVLPFSWVKDIQHIGSTSIPNLTAKPIIDIYVGVESIELGQLAIEPIKSLGYQYWAENPNKLKMFFVKGMPPFGEKRTHHVHIVEYQGDYWQATLIFRDYLRNHPECATQYAELKKTLADQFKYDREAYTDAKSEFVNSILKQAGFGKTIKR